MQDDYPELAPFGVAVELGDTDWIDVILNAGSVLSLLAGYVALIYAVITAASN
jgi:hypothetical protein